MRRTKLEPEIIIAAVQEYLSGKSSYKAIAKRLCVAPETLRGWVRNYTNFGIEAFHSKSNQHYSKALKEQAVQEYLTGKGSQTEICKKYKIKSTRQIYERQEKTV